MAVFVWGSTVAVSVTDEVVVSCIVAVLWQCCLETRLASLPGPQGSEEEW